MTTFAHMKTTPKGGSSTRNKYIYIYIVLEKQASFEVVFATLAYSKYRQKIQLLPNCPFSTTDRKTTSKRTTSTRTIYIYIYIVLVNQSSFVVVFGTLAYSKYWQEIQILPNILYSASWRKTTSKESTSTRTIYIYIYI